MARPFFAGWECGEDSGANSPNSTCLTEYPSVGAGKVTADNTFVFNAIPAGSLREGYVQFRLKVERLPSGGNGKVLIYETRNGLSNPSGTPGIFLTSTGTLEFVSYSGSSTFLTMGTSPALTVGRWYLVQFYCKMNTLTPLPNTNARCDGWLDEVQFMTFAPSSAANSDGINTSAGSFSSTVLQVNSIGTGATGGGAIVSFDDFIMDTAALPQNERIFRLRPTGPGTYQAWGTTSLLGMSGNLSNLFNTSSTTSGAKVSYTAPTLASMGVASGTAITTRILLNGSATGAGAGLFVRVNGVETSVSVNLGAAANAYQVVSSGDIAVTINPSDTLEYGYAKDASGSGRSFAYLSLVCSVRNSQLTPPTPATTVEVDWITYTGDGTTAKLVTLPFEPDLILIFPTGTGNGKLLTCWDSSTYFPQNHLFSTLSTATMLMVMKGQSRMYVTGTAGSAGDVNVNGQLYDVCVIKDAARRCIQLGDFTTPNASADNFNVATTDATFPVDWVSGGNAAASTTGTTVYHGPSTVGDLAYPVGSLSGGAADIIQSVGTGTFQVGTGTQFLKGYFNPWWALTKQRFVEHPLWDMVTYTGNGTSPRTISTAAGGAVKAVLVIPTTAGGLSDGRRGHMRTPSFAGSDARYLYSNGGISTTAITAMGTNGFTAAADCNLSGQGYQALVFFEGTDRTEATVPNVVGLSVGDATTAIIAAGFILGTVGGGDGVVESQSPIAGATALLGSAVNLILEETTVATPDLEGMTLSEALAELAIAELVLGTVTGSGVVVAQNPAAGVVVPIGSAVDLVLDVPPVLQNPGPQTSMEYHDVSLQLIATHPNPASITYSATGLPPDLNCNPVTGLISGTIAGHSADVYPVTVTADTPYFTVPQDFDWTVVPFPIVLAPVPLPDPYTDTPYAQTISATGGDGGPYTFSLVAGSLPPGFTLAPDGTISGTTTGGAVIDPATWPDALVDVLYNEQLVVTESGVDTPYAFTVQATDNSGGSSFPDSTTLLMADVTTPVGSNIINGAAVAAAWNTNFPNSWNGTTGFAFQTAIAGEFRVGGTFFDDGAIPADITVTSARLQFDYTVSFTSWGGAPDAVLHARRNSSSQTTVNFAGGVGGSGSIDVAVAIADRGEIYALGWGWAMSRASSGVPNVATLVTITNFRLLVNYTVNADSPQSGEQAYTVTVRSGWSAGAFFEVLNSAPLPSCLTCSRAGVIAGIPMTVGVFPVTVQVTNSAGGTLTRDYTLTVTSAPVVI